MFQLHPGEQTLIVGFFDLSGYARWCAGRPPAEILGHASALFARAGGSISGAGGTLIKAIGDAGLFAFAADEPDRAVLALLGLKSNLDAWLTDIRFPGRTGIKIGLWPVACGPIGAPGQERLDIYGEVINDAAKLRGYDLIVTPALFSQLTPDLAARFEDRGGALVLA